MLSLCSLFPLLHSSELKPRTVFTDMTRGQPNLDSSLLSLPSQKRYGKMVRARGDGYSKESVLQTHQDCCSYKLRDCDSTHKSYTGLSQPDPSAEKGKWTWSPTTKSEATSNRYILIPCGRGKISCLQLGSNHTPGRLKSVDQHKMNPIFLLFRYVLVDFLFSFILL